MATDTEQFTSVTMVVPWYYLKMIWWDVTHKITVITKNSPREQCFKFTNSRFIQIIKELEIIIIASKLNHIEITHV